MKSKYINRFFACILSLVFTFTAAVDQAQAADDLSGDRIATTVAEFSEYDTITAYRNTQDEQLIAQGFSADEIADIKSNTVEEELLYRKGLSSEILSTHYGYTDEQIALLRAYDGKRVDSAPEMRVLFSSLTVTTSVLIKTNTRCGLLFHWEWDSKPAICMTDGVALRWDATLSDASDNLRIDSKLSNCLVKYYYSDTKVFQREIDFDDMEVYQNASVEFAMEKYINTYYTWAKSGDLLFYADTVDDSTISEVAINFAYGHKTLSPPLVFTYPPSGGIEVSVVDAKKYAGRLTSAGQWVVDLDN